VGENDNTTSGQLGSKSDAKITMGDLLWAACKLDSIIEGTSLRVRIISTLLFEAIANVVTCVGIRIKHIT